MYTERLHVSLKSIHLPDKEGDYRAGVLNIDLLSPTSPAPIQLSITRNDARSLYTLLGVMLAQIDVPD